jgi:hypothetical protein
MDQKSLFAELAGIQLVNFTEVTSIDLAVDTVDLIVSTQDCSLGAILITLTIRDETSVLSSVTGKAVIRGTSAGGAGRVTRLAFILDQSVTLRAFKNALVLPKERELFFVVLIARSTGAFSSFTILAWRLAFTTSGLSRSVPGFVTVVNTKLSLGDSPGVAILGVTVDALSLVVRLTVIVASDTGVITLLTPLGRITI